MTKEIAAILDAYRKIDFTAQKAALATVVHVEGSSYRRPGARMLVTDEGQLTGAISGGCLEGDALRKAQLAMYKETAMIVKYDTMDDDDAKLGVGLGCNGIIHILFEPVHPGKPGNPVELLRKASVKRQFAVIATAFSLSETRNVCIGSVFLLTENGQRYIAPDLPPELQPMEDDCRSALKSRVSAIIDYEGIVVFIEVLEPVISLVILGAGNDILPLVDIAQVLGWEVNIADGRPSYANASRFPAGTCVVVSKPEQLLDKISTDDRTYFLLMTHNYNYDLAALRVLLAKNVPYIGVLGPRKKMERMLSDLDEAGRSSSSALYGPVGLNIGAETPEEIALSIVSEIKAVSAGKPGGMLRDLRERIHPLYQ